MSDFAETAAQAQAACAALIEMGNAIRATSAGLEALRYEYYRLMATAQTWVLVRREGETGTPVTTGQWAALVDEMQRKNAVLTGEELAAGIWYELRSNVGGSGWVENV